MSVLSHTQKRPKTHSRMIGVKDGEGIVRFDFKNDKNCQFKIQICKLKYLVDRR